MKLEYRIRVLAGTMVLASLALGHWVNSWWLLLAAFVGVNLVQSAFTGFCPACNILRRIFPDSPGACGQREAEQAAKAGFGASVTTRHGHRFAEHLQHSQLLPRIDVGYAPQSRAALAARLSGLHRAMSTRFGTAVATLV